MSRSTSVRDRARVLPWALLLSILPTTPLLAQDPVEPVQPVGEEDRIDNRLGGTANLRGTGQLTFTREADLRVGPFILRPGVGAGAGAESFARARTDAGTRFDLDARFFVDAGPSLDVLLPIGSGHLFSVSGEALFRHYFADTRDSLGRRLDGWQYTGAGGYQYSSERFGAALTYTAQQRQEGPLEFIARGGGGDLSDVDDRVEVLRRTAGARLQFAVGRRSSLEVAGTRRDTDYEEEASFAGIDLSRALDRTTYGLTASLEREMTPSTTLGLFGDAQRNEFDDVDSFRDNWRTRGGLRARFAGGTTGPGSGSRSSPLGGRLEAGVEIRSLSDRTRTAEEAETLGDEIRDNFTGVFGRGDLRFRVHPRVGLSARANARTQSTFWRENTYFINEGLGGGIDVWVHRRLNIGAFVDYAEQRYPEPATVELTDGTEFTAKRRDELLIYRAVLRFRIFGQGLSIQGGFFDRESNFSLVDSRGYFLRFGLGAGFSVSEDL